MTNDGPRSVEETIETITTETAYEQALRQADSPFAGPTWQRAAAQAVAAGVVTACFLVVGWLLGTDQIARGDAASVLWPGLGGVAFLFVGTGGAIAVDVWRTRTAPHEDALAHRIVAAEQTFAAIGIGTGGIGAVASGLLIGLFLAAPETYAQLVTPTEMLLPPVVVSGGAVFGAVLVVVNVAVVVVSRRDSR